MKSFIRSLQFVIKNDPDNLCLMRSYLRVIGIPIDPRENVLDRAIAVLAENGIEIDRAEILYRTEARAILASLETIDPDDYELRWMLIDQLQAFEIHRPRKSARGRLSREKLVSPLSREG